MRKWVRFPAQLNMLLEYASEKWDWPILTIQILEQSALRQTKQLPAACRHWHFKMKSQVAAEEAEAAPACRQSVCDRNFDNSRASSECREVFKCQINIRPYMCILNHNSWEQKYQISLIMKIFSYSSLSLLLSPLRCLELALKWNVHYMQIHTYCLSNTDVATVRLEKQQLTDEGFVGLEHSPEEHM